jgi:hypothetical protein
MSVTRLTVRCDECEARGTPAAGAALPEGWRHVFLFRSKGPHRLSMCDACCADETGLGEGLAPRPLVFSVHEPNGRECARVNYPRHAAAIAVELGPCQVFYAPDDPVFQPCWVWHGDAAGKTVDDVESEIVDRVYAWHATLDRLHGAAN